MRDGWIFRNPIPGLGSATLGSVVELECALAEAILAEHPTRLRVFGIFLSLVALPSAVTWVTAVFTMYTGSVLYVLSGLSFAHGSENCHIEEQILE